MMLVTSWSCSNGSKGDSTVVSPNTDWNLSYPLKMPRHAVCYTHLYHANLIVSVSEIIYDLPCLHAGDLVFFGMKLATHGYFNTRICMCLQ